MNDERLGGAALIAGAAAFIVTAAMHPTGHDLFAPGNFEHAARLSVVAHALAIASLPASFLGTLALTRWRAGSALGIAALVVYGFALVAAMIAAVASGLVAPRIAGAMLAAGPEQRDGWDLVLRYNGHVNQAFAWVWLVGSSCALLGWSAALVRGAALARGLGVYGLVLAPVTVVGLLSGHLRLDVHGLAMVVLGQSAWFVAAGVLLWRRPAD